MELRHDTEIRDTAISSQNDNIACTIKEEIDVYENDIINVSEASDEARKERYKTFLVLF